MNIFLWQTYFFIMTIMGEMQYWFKTLLPLRVGILYLTVFFSSFFTTHLKTFPLDLK